MAYTLEISYFNSVILKPDTLVANVPTNALNLTPFTISDATSQTGDWHIEESRIKGGFNEDSMGFGVKAYITETNDEQSVLKNSLIYSGVYNSRTGVNNTNQFSIGEDITRSLNPANGSIQKLYSTNTNLNVFQENKISRAIVTSMGAIQVVNNATDTISQATKVNNIQSEATFG